MRKQRLVATLSFQLWLGALLSGQQPAGSQATPPQLLPTRAPTRADFLRGEYGRHRANNDLLSYNLAVRVDPDEKRISGRNTIRFRMLQDDTRIQLDLYANLAIERMVAFFNKELGQDLTPIFDQYLRRTALPTQELAFNQKEGTVAYRWNADERAFAMPIRVGAKDKWQVIQSTTDWKIMPNAISKDAFDVSTNLYYVNVTKQ